jgi:hypothetical protein
MKILVIILSLASMTALASSQLDQARACYNDVGIQVSITLSQAAHAAKPGSKAEKLAQEKYAAFSDYFETFPIFETACNEAAPNGEEEMCKLQGYENETAKLVHQYKLWNSARHLESCKVI